MDYVQFTLLLHYKSTRAQKVHCSQQNNPHVAYALINTNKKERKKPQTNETRNKIFS